MALDDVVGVISPRRAMMRKSYRFGYDILDKHRTRKKRSDMGGPGDWHLSQEKLDKLREICRDLGRNNPLVKGIFRKLATKIVGTATKVQARTEDEGWNKAAEQLWREEMVNVPCDVTGRFNVHAFLKKMYYTYCRDGDMFMIFTDDGIQAIEGDQVGTPYGKKAADHFDVINGVAVSKKTKKVIGYYIGKPNKWGYIANESVQRSPPAGRRHHGRGAGLAVYGCGVGAIATEAEHWAEANDAAVEAILENDWTRGVPKNTRQIAIANLYQEYRIGNDPGGDIADAIGMAVWWLRRRVLY